MVDSTNQNTASPMADAQLVQEILARLPVHPESVGLLTHFEIPRIRYISRSIQKLKPEQPLRILNIGFLEGVVPFILLQQDTEQRFYIVSTERDSAENLQIGMSMDKTIFPENRHELRSLDLDLLSEEGDIAEWKAEYGSFDAIVFGEVIEHIPSIFAERIFRFFGNLLKSDGIAITTTPNANALIYRLRHGLGLDYLHDPLRSPTMGYGHVNLYSARLLCDIARHCDLAIDSIVYANLTSDALFANRGGGLKTALYRGFRKGLFQFSPELGDDLFVTVRKVSAKQQTSAMFDLSNSSVRQAREAAREIRPFHRKLEE